MDITFTGKTVVVTGAGSGIGRGIALEFAKNGADVWIADIAEANARATLDEMKAGGGKYGFTKTDVSKQEDVAKLFEEAKKGLGRIDIVVNSAGVFCTKTLLEATPEDIKQHLGINLLGMVYSCQLALETMIEQGGGGKICNIASVGGRAGELDFPFYALGKSGVLNFTQSVAYNAAPHQVNVNAVCPGIIRTPMWELIISELSGGEVEPEKRDEFFTGVLKERTPLGRAQTEEEIAYAVLFLCSEYADSITGQALNVCGGAKMN